MLSFLTETSPSTKTFTCSSIYGCRVTRFTIILTFLLIASTPAAAIVTTTTASASI